mmetsp:Transcript_15267/g.41001  ORF Transcript_15267/g.41001 Transcript_15267/m.41001 type:complete len:498 (+) Transcript_15267:86-1579(+)
MASDDSERRTARPNRTAKYVVLVCINLSNLVCHSVYSVLASFFPQEARAKGLSDEPIGLVFAIFAAVIFVAAPFVSTALSRYGKRQVYVAGLAIVAVGTMLFSLAAWIENRPAYFAWCLALRCVQGLGSALEETAAYALIADIDPNAVSFNLGITEISTGLGYMVGPTLGGILFAMGGFAAPFICIGTALVPALFLIMWTVPDDSAAAGREAEAAAEAMATPLQTLLTMPQVFAIALVAVFGNSDYAFLEPTLAAHVETIAATSTQIGMLFSVTSLTYTLASPLMGWLSHQNRMGPRTVIWLGTALQAAGFLCIGPSPLLTVLLGYGLEDMPVSLPLVCLALFLFGLGEAMSMTPLMEDMMLSCVDRKADVINSLSALMTSCFSLGQMVGPLMGSFLSARVGFTWSSTLVGVVMAAQTALLVHLQRSSRRHQHGRSKCIGWGGQREQNQLPGELEPINVNLGGVADHSISVDGIEEKEREELDSEHTLAPLHRKWSA